MRNSRRAALLCAVGLLTTSALLAAPTSVSATPSGSPPVHGGVSPTDALNALKAVDDAQLILDSRLPAASALDLLTKSSPDHPIEVRFQNGAWAGGVLAAGDTPTARKILANFLADSPAARGEAPVTGLKASRATIEDRLAAVPGARSYRDDFKAQVAKAAEQTLADVKKDVNVDAQTAAATVYCTPNTDCEKWINTGSATPSVPVTGKLDQWRLQGVIEYIHHEIKQLSKTGYPALVKTVYATGNHAWIKPKYGYEHDYKVTNNGYVSTTDAYSWSTNLPGPYKDTRASDDPSKLDFTIGAMYTWQFDSTKTYTVNTQVATSAAADSSTALLTAQVLPNDGGFTPAAAVLGDGCLFQTSGTGDQTQPLANALDYSWCTGIGGGLGSSTRTISYISTTPFTIKYDGTCRVWTYEHGAVNC